MDYKVQYNNALNHPDHLVSRRVNLAGKLSHFAKQWAVSDASALVFTSLLPAVLICESATLPPLQCIKHALCNFLELIRLEINLQQLDACPSSAHLCNPSAKHLVARIKIRARGASTGRIDLP